MFIGEAPGHDEDSNTGRPFTGQAGREFNQKYLPLAYLTRDDIYLTNTVKCRPEANKTPGTALINSCSSAFLDYEFQLFQPSILVPMGAVALSWVSTRMEEAERYSSLPGNEFPRPLNILLQHGIPFKVKILGMDTTVFPVFHPALGLHDGKAIFHLRRDFQKLGEFIKEQSGLYRDLSTEEGRRLWDMVEKVATK